MQYRWPIKTQLFYERKKQNFTSLFLVLELKFSIRNTKKTAFF